jgi:hypothetical protein
MPVTGRSLNVFSFIFYLYSFILFLAGVRGSTPRILGAPRTHHSAVRQNSRGFEDQINNLIST